ncbi:hypothetical protein Q3G72_032138 [Acer saccharum]|nr:hypothetical protein Q3G72_032138 [Acer saccharum]
MDIGPKRVGVSIFSVDMETICPIGVIYRSHLYHQNWEGNVRHIAHAHTYNLGIVEQLKGFHVTTYIDELVSSMNEVILLLLYTKVDESRTSYSLDIAHAVANRFKKDIQEGDYPFGTPLTQRLYYNDYGFDYNKDDHKDMVSACFIGEFVTRADPKVVALAVNNVGTLNAQLQELEKLKLLLRKVASMSLRLPSNQPNDDHEMVNDPCILDPCDYGRPSPFIDPPSGPRTCWQPYAKRNQTSTMCQSSEIYH